jgi:Fe-S-cluster-containing hydrogenase component 2
MCDDRPCITACPTGALRLDVPAKMGTAGISPIDCLAHAGCSACVEQCPVAGAIRLENGRPVVDPAACTGCGVCQSACPAPRNAVLIVPTRDRPTPPS